MGNMGMAENEYHEKMLRLGQQDAGARPVMGSPSDIPEIHGLVDRVEALEKALTGAQFVIHVEYNRHKNDPEEYETTEILAEVGNEIAALIGPYYPGKVSS